MIFLKLGGSLITDKTQVETIRPKILQRVSSEIASAIAATPTLQLLLGHGSGSFGHVPAKKYGTRQGVTTREEWHGFAEVSQAASKLTAIVRDHLMAEGVSLLSLTPRVSAVVENGQITSMHVANIQAALRAGLVPMVNGDVAFDHLRGGTIVSTEEVMAYLAAFLHPRWLILAGETDGVYDLNGDVIPNISHANLADIRAALGGSRGTDVTGGMLTKVTSMLDLVTRNPHLSIKIISGLKRGNVEMALLDPENVPGTLIRP